MTINEAQQKVDEWIKTVGVRYYSELTNMAILTEEVGELASIMARKYGDQSFKESDSKMKLEDEMADVLWVLICLANQTGVDLTTALQHNFEKKTTRDAARHRNNPKTAMSLDKIVQIERSVGIYRNSDDEVVEEIVIDIPLDTLKEIVPPKEDDPELYEGYVLDEQQLEKINSLLENKIIPDYTENYYVLEATGIYDWSAN